MPVAVHEPHDPARMGRAEQLGFVGVTAMFVGVAVVKAQAQDGPSQRRLSECRVWDTGMGIGDRNHHGRDWHGTPGGQAAVQD